MTKQAKKLCLVILLALVCAIVGVTSTNSISKEQKKTASKVNSPSKKVTAAKMSQAAFLRWQNDPKIEAIESEARKVLGWQVYGAINCGDLFYSYFDLHENSQQLHISREEAPTIKRVSKLHRKKIPLIITRKVYGGAGVSADSETYLQEYRAIVGTRAGEIYEFWWSDSRDPDWAMIFSHRKWQKPTFKHKGNEILFFDASQNAKK